MSNYEVLVKDGPSEATLAHALDRRAPVVFRVDEGVLEARLDALEELRDEAGLAISGSMCLDRIEGRRSLGLTTEQGVGVASSSSAFPDAPLPARRMHNYEIEIVANLDGTHIG